MRYQQLFYILIITSSLNFLNCNKKEENSNELAKETSSYLLQHADDPVHWKTWDDTLIKHATTNNKLIIVSIGFSSCHWCHVMEKETFEDNAVAIFMNNHFINIKVDREERPDIDHLYMTAVQMMTGSGGWPLNVILLPNGKPIYGGTYHTQKEWISVLKKIKELYAKEPDKLHAYADNIALGIQENNLVKIVKKDSLLSKDTFKNHINQWKQRWDMVFGGTKTTQKFIKPSEISLWMKYAYLSNDSITQKQVIRTLNNISNGGIFDHVGGGFFRYTTDEQWKVPHFEKMLYTNAQLLSLFSNAYKAYKIPTYKYIIEKTANFLLSEMKSSEGGYYSSINADSEGKEGKFYVWNKTVLKSILKDRYNDFSEQYKYQPLHKNSKEKDLILYKNTSLDKNKQQDNEYAISVLYKQRQQRIKPKIDNKIITSWNALLITGFVDAYKALGKKDYLKQAEKLADLVYQNAFEGNKLYHTLANKQSFLEDYAFLIEALIKLYTVTSNEKYASRANELTAIVMANFSDKKSSMFTFTESSQLVSKLIKINDGVLPSPNAIMANNLYRLGILFRNSTYLKKSKIMLSSMIPFIENSFTTYSKWNTTLLDKLYSFKEVIVTGSNAASFATSFHSSYLPNTFVVYSTKKNNLVVFSEKHVDNETFIYVCEEGFCKLPTLSTEEAFKQLKN